MKKYIYTIGMLLCSLTAIAQEAYCPPDMTITNPINETEMIIQAVSTITASNTIQSNASVIYRAGDDITFVPSFDALSGAAFDALIEACVPSITEPNDPLFYLQWGHYNTGLVRTYEEGVLVEDRPLINGEFDADADILEVWEITTGSPDITVALLDSGIDIGHPDFYHSDPDSLRIVDGYNFLNNTTDIDDTMGHGTLVAGILGAIANNNEGIAGVDQQCMIMPLKVVNDSGTNIDPNDVAVAIQHAITHNADIISMSFGWPGELSYELEEAMRNAIDANVLLIAAAGNDNAALDYPARYASVAGVGALSPCNTRKRSSNDPAGISCDNDNRADGDDVPHWGSNYGEGLDFLAPGVLLPSTDVLGPTGYSDFEDNGVLQYQSIENGDYILDTYGTSMSSPFAAGVAALVWAEEPGLKNYQVRDILQKTAVATLDGNVSINALAAVEYAQNPPESLLLLPNLILEVVDTPTVENSGQDIAIPYRVINTGDVTSASTFTLKYYLTKISNNNSNNDLVGIEVEIGGVPVLDTNNTGASFEGTAIIPIAEMNCDDEDLAVKNYNVNFEIDVDSEVEEFNEFNHFREMLQPDLMVEDEQPHQPSLIPSKSGGYSLTYKIKNIGVGKAHYFRTSPNPFYRNEYYISENDKLDPKEDQLLESIPSIGFGLCPQNSRSVEINLDIPDDANYLLIQVDATGVIDESNEEYNVYALQLTPAINPMEEPIGIDPVEDPVASAKAKNSGEPKENTSELVVSPNPFEGSVSFEFYTEQNAKVALAIYDVEGKLQLEKQLNYQEEGQQLIEANLSTLASGVYFYKLFVNKKPFSGKIIKK